MDRHPLSHSPGCEESKLKVPTALVLSQGRGEDSFPYHPLRFCWFAGHPWCSLAPDSVTPISAWRPPWVSTFLPSVPSGRPHFPFSSGQQSSRLESPLIFHLVTSLTSLSPSKVTFTGTGGQDFDNFWGDTLQPLTLPLR